MIPSEIMGPAGAAPSPGGFFNRLLATGMADQNHSFRAGQISCREKAVFLNPRTRYEDIDRFIAAIRGSSA